MGTLQAAADHLEQRIGQYNPQNVCNILWSYATLGYYPGGSPLDVAADYALHALEVSSHPVPAGFDLVELGVESRECLMRDVHACQVAVRCSFYNICMPRQDPLAAYSHCCLSLNTFLQLLRLPHVLHALLPICVA